MATIKIGDPKQAKDRWSNPLIYVTDPMTNEEMNEYLNDFLERPHTNVLEFAVEMVTGGGSILGRVFAVMVYQERSGMPIPIAGDEDDGY